MKVGDLVTGVDWIATDASDTGLVLAVIRDVEIPPIIEVLWDNGVVSRTYQDELRILCKTSHDMVE